MYKFLIVGILLLPLIAIKSQVKFDFQTADSITYNCYLKGDWENLISNGNQAIKSGISFKTLHQRMGYAYFVKQRYTESKNQYEKALIFDESDQDTRLYLYYCGINLSDDEYSRYQLSKLSSETKKWLKINDNRLIDAVDVEYNYKINNSQTRTNPIFYKAGVNTILWNRLSFYQSFSQFFQTINTASPAKQTEYLARVNWLFSTNANIDLIYRYVYTNVYNDVTKANLYQSRFNTHIDWLLFNVHASVLTDGNNNFCQTGTEIGATIPGRSHFTIKGGIDNLLLADNKLSVSSRHYVFTGKISLTPIPKMWTEICVSNGNMKNYSEGDGMYLYSSIDPTLYKIGTTIFWNISYHWSLYTNYTFEKKLIEETNSNYNQHSILGGIIWKL